MDFSLIGKEIKVLRSALNLSQAELSEGICTQSQISKIEKGEVFPLANTLYYIAERLGVDINYFYDLATNPQLSYVKEVFAQVKELLNRSEFEEVYNIVENERKNPLFVNNRKNKQFLLSTEGVCVYHLKNNKREALRLLQSALDLTKMTSKLLGEREIEILNSMAIVHFETKNCEEALRIFNHAINCYMKIPYHHDPTIKTKILYNKAKTLTRLNKLEESNDTCKLAVKWCVKQNSLYGLGNLYYHIGYNYSLLDHNDIAIEYFNKSIQIFMIQENKVFVKHIKEKIDELSVLID
ncbi:helix-turn-helix domain-containing protein [Bacillus sp. CHD6a]|uniref:helix-turn-helix domain-containing protein n=1 Tax=Bacillus sp. CHD6a TaxID=1643452 RepID=UPI0006CC4FB5|nr:helix-turn-helix domain-containing protein [Bacillus sp. CHD6a]KPB05087.1 hypothetical protein AAV98_08360 [Bacillus sp. CHD6a]